MLKIHAILCKCTSSLSVYDNRTYYCCCCVMYVCVYDMDVCIMSSGSTFVSHDTYVHTDQIIPYQRYYTVSYNSRGAARSPDASQAINNNNEQLGCDGPVWHAAVYDKNMYVQL